MLLAFCLYWAGLVWIHPPLSYPLELTLIWFPPQPLHKWLSWGSLMTDCHVANPQFSDFVFIRPISSIRHDWSPSLTRDPFFTCTAGRHPSKVSLLPLWLPLCWFLFLTPPLRVAELQSSVLDFFVYPPHLPWWSQPLTAFDTIDT